MSLDVFSELLKKRKGRGKDMGENEGFWTPQGLAMLLTAGLGLTGSWITGNLFRSCESSARMQ